MNVKYIIYLLCITMIPVLGMEPVIMRERIHAFWPSRKYEKFFQLLSNGRKITICKELPSGRMQYSLLVIDQNGATIRFSSSQEAIDAFNKMNRKFAEQSVLSNVE